MKKLMVESLVVATVGLAARWFVEAVGISHIVNPDRAVMVSLWLALVWGALVLYGFFRFKKQALWLLVGAPAALFWPYIVAVIFWDCIYYRWCP
jgi:hypothetical protein